MCTCTCSRARVPQCARRRGWVSSNWPSSSVSPPSLTASPGQSFGHMTCQPHQTSGKKNVSVQQTFISLHVGNSKSGQCVSTERFVSPPRPRTLMSLLRDQPIGKHLHSLSVGLKHGQVFHPLLSCPGHAPQFFTVNHLYLKKSLCFIFSDAGETGRGRPPPERRGRFPPVRTNQ